MKCNKFSFNNFIYVIICKAYSKLIPVTVRNANSKLVSKISFKAMGVCKDIQYNKEYISFLNLIKLKISETVIEINFNSNIFGG